MAVCVATSGKQMLVPLRPQRAAHRHEIATPECVRNKSHMSRDTSVKCVAAEEGGTLSVLTEFGHTAQLDAGVLRIAPIKEAEIPGVAVLMARAGAGSPEAIKVGDTEEYLNEMVAYPPEAVLLVARLDPTEESGVKLPPGQTTRIVGCVVLSFSAYSREQYVHNRPPDDDIYLCNMAVDPKCRRLGVAKELLSACDSASLHYAPDKDTVWLHVRTANTAASKLYDMGGYKVIKQDSMAVRLQNREPEKLMNKILRSE